MDCLHCKGRMQQSAAAFSIDRNGYHISWERVPAWVCDQCGEPFFEAREVDLLQEAISAVDRQTALLSAPSGAN